MDGRLVSSLGRVFRSAVAAEGHNGTDKLPKRQNTKRTIAGDENEQQDGHEEKDEGGKDEGFEVISDEENDVVQKLTEESEKEEEWA